MKDVESLEEREVNLGKPYSRVPQRSTMKGSSNVSIHYIPKLANGVCMGEQCPLMYRLVDSKASGAMAASAILS